MKLRKYDSVTDMIAAVHSGDTVQQVGRQFNGGMSTTQAVEAALKGWSAVRPQADRMIGQIVESLADRVTSTIQVQSWYNGPSFDVGELLAGAEMPCFNAFIVDEPETSPTVRIVIDPGANAKYSADWMTNRALAIAALMELVKRAGKQVEVWASSPVYGNGVSYQTTTVCVHKAGDVVDIDKLMFLGGHPGMLRSILFGFRAKDGVVSMGRSLPIDNRVFDQIGFRPDVIIHRHEHEIGKCGDYGPCSSLCGRRRGKADPGRDPKSWVLEQLAELKLIKE